MRLTHIATVAAALGFAGCTTSDDQHQTGCTGGKCDGIGDGTTIPGPELLRCWIVPGTGDPFFRVEQLHCDYQPPAGYPLQTSATLNVSSTPNPSTGAGAFFPDPAAPAGQPSHFVMSFRVSDYPLAARLDIQLGDVATGSTRVLGASLPTSVSMALAFPDDHTNLLAAPATASVPFDLWPVRLLAYTDDLTARFTYPLVLAGATAHDGTGSIAINGSISTFGFGTAVGALLAVSPGTTMIHGEWHTPTAGPTGFDLGGPGNYVATDTGVQLATPDQRPRRGEGDELAHCWIEKIEAVPTLRCLTAGPATGLTVTSATVAVRAGTGTATTTPIPLGVTTTIGAIDASMLPLRVELGVQLSGNAIGPAASWLAHPYSVVDVLTALPTDPATPIALLRLPFDLWTVTISTTVDGFQAVLDPYVLRLGESWGGLFAVQVPDAQTPWLSSGESQTITIAAPHGATELSAKAVILDGSSLTDTTTIVIRPGSFRATASGLEPI